MHNPITVDDNCWFAHNGATIQNYGDIVDGMWGGGGIEITKGQLSELMQGKVLYFTIAGEYACLLRIEKDE